MTDEKRPLKVFLCYTHSDQVAARALYKRLVKEGIDAWLDKEKLFGGANWEYEIRKAVRESDVVIVCLSKQFSAGGFRQKEVQIALDEAALKPKEEIFIIPVRLEECDVPEQLEIWHWLDLFRRGGYYKLVASLKSRGLQLQRAPVELPKPDETTPNLAEELKSEQTKNIFVNVDGNMQGNIIIGNENAVQSQTTQPEPEKQVDPKPPVVTEKREPEKPPRKLKTKYIIAIIGATATILAALIGILPQFIKPAPLPTTTITVTMPVTSAPTTTLTVPYSSKTPEPSLTPITLPTPTLPSISLNPMENTDWDTYTASGTKSKIDIWTVPGKTNNALLISFTLPSNGWVGITNSLYPGILVGTHALRFSYRGDGSANSLEIKLLYGPDQKKKTAVFSVLLNGISNMPSWTTTEIPYTEFNCWIDTGCPAGMPIDISQVLKMDFAISNKPGNPSGDGHFIIDDVEAIK